MKKTIIGIFFLYLISVFLAALTNTGNLIVIVKDPTGGVIPDATVTLFSENHSEALVQLTDQSGKTLFRRLQPGSYTVEACMEGFMKSAKEEVNITVQKTSRLTLSLSLTDTEESITVSGDAPLIDPTSSTTSFEFDFYHYIDHSPVRRHYSAIAGLAGGTLRGNNPSVFGGGRGENLYTIEGITLTDPRTQQWGRQFNVDSIEDSSMLATGIPAEYGHMMGSVFNIVTKSGSNILHGIGRLEMSRPGWNDLTLNDSERTDDDIREGAKEDEWNVSGGGPLVPDYAWWYISYSDRNRFTDWQRRMNPLDDGELTPAVKAYIGYYFTAKGTVQLGSDFRGNIIYIEDPIDTGNSGSYYDYGSRMQPSADLIQKEGGSSTLASASWAISENIFIEGRWLDGTNRIDITAQAESPEGYWERSSITGPSFNSVDDWWWGSIPRDYQSKRNRTSYAGALNILAENGSIGNHDIKLGIEYLHEWCTVRDTLYPSGEAIFTGEVSAVGFENAEWSYRYLITDMLPAAEDDIEYWTYYLQDAAQLSDQLTLNIGIRSDMATGTNNHDEEVIKTDLTETLALRFGIAFAFDDHQLHASAGRYYDLFSLYILDGLNRFDRPEKWEMYEPIDPDDTHAGWKLVDSWTIGDAQSPHTINDDLTPQYMDELTIGLDLQLGKNIALGLNGIWRMYRDLIIAQDMDSDHHVNYENLYTYAYGSLWKEYLAVIFSLRKSPADDNLFLEAFLTISNIEGLCNDSYSIGTYGDNPLQRYENAEEWWGPVTTMSSSSKASADPTIQFKLHSTYFFANGWYVGINTIIDNNYLPTTYNTRYVDDFGKVTIYPNGRGDMDRLPAFIDIYLQVGIEQQIELPFQLPLTDDDLIIGIYLNISNVINSQQASGIQTYQNASDYGEDTKWRSAREYILGFRCEL